MCKEKAILSNSFIQDLITYIDIELYGSKSIMLEDVYHLPLYMYFDFKREKDQKLYLLNFS